MRPIERLEWQLGEGGRGVRATRFSDDASVHWDLVSAAILYADACTARQGPCRWYILGRAWGRRRAHLTNEPFVRANCGVPARLRATPSGPDPEFITAPK
jgi:hypothetical protein